MKRNVVFGVIGASIALFLCQTVRAENPPPLLAMWGTHGTGDGQFSDPYSVAVDESGNVYVVDFGNRRIQKFDGDGNFLLTWGSYGSGDGQFNLPAAIAAGRDGSVYVTDYGDHRVQKFDSDGNFLLTWGTYGTGDGQFSVPFGVTLDDFGHLYVTEAGNHRVQKFDSDGGFLAKWGSYGTGDGQFFAPFMAATSSTGDVYVAEHNNYRVQKFDSDGNFLLKWGSYGTGDRQFRSPEGVTVDGVGNVYVVDSGDRSVKKFDGTGTFLLKWSSQFNNPLGVAAGSFGNIYVADRYNNRIQKFGTDADWDSLVNEADNCPWDWNQAQADTDGDGAGDLCDICPADQMDSCNAGGSSAGEIDSDAGGTVETPDGSLNLDIEPGDLGTDETISVTETVFNDPEVDLTMATGAGKGNRLLVYDLQPDGLVFDQPITLTIEADVTNLNATQRANLNLYLQTTIGDLEPIPGSSCEITQGPPGVFIVTCTAEISHFSVYALVAPLDSDADGVPDSFGELMDGCPFDPLLVTPEFDGFLPPIGGADDTGGGFDDPIRTFKHGSTVPIKFRMYCEGNPVVEGGHILELVNWSDGTNSDPPIDATPRDEATSGNEFVLTGLEWHFNLDTKPLSAGQWEVIATLDDGSQHNVWIQLR